MPKRGIVGSCSLYQQKRVQAQALVALAGTLMLVIMELQNGPDSPVIIAGLTIFLVFSDDYTQSLHDGSARQFA